MFENDRRQTEQEERAAKVEQFKAEFEGKETESLEAQLDHLGVMREAMLNARDENASKADKRKWANKYADLTDKRQALQEILHIRANAEKSPQRYEEEEAGGEIKTSELTPEAAGSAEKRRAQSDGEKEGEQRFCLFGQ